MPTIHTIFLIVFLFTLFACNKNSKHQTPAKDPFLQIEQLIAASKAPVYPFKIIHTYPHDTQNFTEGLYFDNGFLYESTGLYQHSKLQQKDLITGKVLLEYVLSPHYFAEGIAVMGNDIYQLSYKERTGFVYDKNTLQLKKTFHYPTEGWGLTSDGKELIMSNGTAMLYFIHPNTFHVIRTITVQDQNQAVYFLNSLQYIHGKIYANVWPTDMIAIISPDTGKVLGWINIEPLNIHQNCVPEVCVSNGIAYRKKTHTLLVTGKNWPFIYEIQLMP